MLFIVLVITLILIFLAARAARRKNVDIIIRARLRERRENYEGLKHVFFCFVDHFEPLWNGASKYIAVSRVEKWRKSYPTTFGSIRDDGGRVPQHTFFYPQEEYIPDCLDMLSELKSMGFGDVEIHIHHDHDSREAFRDKITSFKEKLHDRHGLLHENPARGIIEYGFIHGNWALDDSGPGGRYCGVKDEIAILTETGCYADFTYPSAPHPTQPPIVNRIYYATGDPEKPKSHHKGIDAAFSSRPGGDLLLISGPLAINWRGRRKWIFPAIENSAITADNPATQPRVDLWIRAGISVRGWPRWVFVKIYTHGAQDRNSELLLGKGITRLHEYLLSRYNDGERFLLHYVTARELYNCIKVLEGGDRGEIERFENFEYSL